VPELADLTGPVLACSTDRGAFRYSHGGYAALGALIDEVTGSSYADAATRLVLAPLGMTGASFPDQWPDEDAITGYLLDADDGMFGPAPKQVCTVPAAAGLWATAEDLVLFATGWRSLLPDELAREALTPQADRAPAAGQMGLGWILNTDQGLAGHQGAGAAGSASLITRGDVVAVALASRALPIEPIAARVLRAIA
jgi:CubicO group peptidase (beta-lactamase class C family)